MISEQTVLAALKELFKTTPSIEDYIAAHNPTDIYQVERLQQQYDRLIGSNPLWD